MTDSARRRLLRVVLTLAGLTLVASLVRAAGPDRIERVLREAAWWLPLIVSLEIAQIVSDVIALRMLLANYAARVPVAAWIRSSMVAYAMMVVLPAGRAAGEIARATLLARHVGASWAATIGTQLQSAYFLANGLLSAAALGVVVFRFGIASALSLMLLANTLLMTLLACSLLGVLRGDRAGRWIERLRSRLPSDDTDSPPLDPSTRRRLPWQAAVVCTTSRAAQVGQYGVILAAVGGIPTIRAAFIVHGIHLVGSTLGDAMPNQLGVVDGAYRAFAADIGFSDAPARALSIAFVAHATQLLCAGVCVVVAAIARVA